MDIQSAIAQPITSFFDPGQRIFWLYILTAVAIAMIIFVVTKGRSERLRGFLAFVFPANVWRHRSTHTDIAYFVINRVLFTLLLAPFALAAYPYLNSLIVELLQSVGSPGTAPAPTYVLVVYGIAAIAAFDLAIYLSHLAQHKWSFLWQFHKVHHSAEVLNPLTAYRMHPVDDLLTLSVAALFASIIHSIFSFFWADSFSSIQAAATGIAVMIFYLFGYHLRHSHIWLSYGPQLSRYLISPAQHQIHHSREERHRDKNLGYMFAVWDRIFGTLYVPGEKEDFELGLGSEPSDVYQNVLTCYVKPFRDAYRLWRQPIIFAATALIGVSALSVGAETGSRQAKTVFLEDLTSSEVEALIDVGYRSVIVPTGGVEQNGDHVVLGKHNLVISHAAERVALQLGRTLVAPVVKYVPQGGIDPPQDHMRFAGTISLRESTFEAVLEDVTRSLIQHGFDKIYYVGDSAGNQNAQARVASRLDSEYAERGISVLHVGDYYENNGQFDSLRERGFSDEQIGWHAGLRDTSEMLFVAHDAVRREALRLSARKPGVSGAYWRASEEIGAAMLELKVAAALRQIRAEDGTR